ncbi:MAG TPA: hypothetical protein VMH87_17095 [Pseudomonadales bacterium]|nr:hypothetical protein [Pseudomonadales bacterium]
MNLFFGWLWILMGIISGTVLGMFFHGDRWLGGYGSFKRRMYRLGHISFFGLGLLNLMFWLTVLSVTPSTAITDIASAAFISGGITMPICCVIMAHAPKAHMLFAVPVISLICAGVLMVMAVSSNAMPAHAGLTPFHTQSLAHNSK